MSNSNFSPQRHKGHKEKPILVNLCVFRVFVGEKLRHRKQMNQLAFLYQLPEAPPPPDDPPPPPENPPKPPPPPENPPKPPPPPDERRRLLLPLVNSSHHNIPLMPCGRCHEDRREEPRLLMLQP